MAVKQLPLAVLSGKKEEEATVSIMKIKDKIGIKRQSRNGGGAGGEGGGEGGERDRDHLVQVITEYRTKNPYQQHS